MKITEKVSYNIASEASYAYFQKEKKIKKIEKFEKLEFQREWMLTFILWYIFGDFQTLCNTADFLG